MVTIFIFLCTFILEGDLALGGKNKGEVMVIFECYKILKHKLILHIILGLL